MMYLKFDSGNSIYPDEISQFHNISLCDNNYLYDMIYYDLSINIKYVDNGIPNIGIKHLDLIKRQVIKNKFLKYFKGKLP